MIFEFDVIANNGCVRRVLDFRSWIIKVLSLTAEVEGKFLNFLQKSKWKSKGGNRTTVSRNSSEELQQFVSVRISPFSAASQSMARFFSIYTIGNPRKKQFHLMRSFFIVAKANVMADSKKLVSFPPCNFVNGQSITMRSRHRWVLTT